MIQFFAIETFIRHSVYARVSRTSSLVRQMQVYPLTSEVYFNKGISNQPQRRFRLVTTPNSTPRVCNKSPISLKKKERNFVKILIVLFAYNTYIQLFGGERSITYTGCISFNNTNNFANSLWRQAKTSQNATYTAITTCDIRISAKIDV